MPRYKVMYYTEDGEFFMGVTQDFAKSDLKEYLKQQTEVLKENKFIFWSESNTPIIFNTDSIKHVELIETNS